ncbi:MAG: hypothetical protein ACRCZS_10455 [Chroococcidiopsis sp.]
MPAAVVTTSTIGQTITQANLTTGIDAALQAAGMGTPVATQTGAINRLVYSKVLNAAKIKSTIFLEIQITTAMAVTARISDNYNTGAFTATNQSGPSTSVTFVPGTNILMTGFQHTEMYSIAMKQGTVFTHFGISRPANKPAWWDEDLFLYGFLVNSGIHKVCALTANPHNYATTINIGPKIYFDPTTVNVSAQTTLNLATGQIHPESPVLIGSSQGGDGYYSSDFQTGTSLASAEFPSKYTENGEEYTLLTNVDPRLAFAIKTV